MATRVTDYSLYRWRYPLGYIAMIMTVVLLVVLAGIYVPGALRAGEIDASLKSGALSTQSLAPEMLVDLPYHILQRASFFLFGVSAISIKLPSLILGVFTIIGIFLLIRTWFRRNVAILITVLAASTAQFMFLLQDGTPQIMYSFVAIWLLLAATYVSRQKTFGTLWKVLTGVLMAMAMYMPLGVYLNIAIVITMMFHPHIRYVIRKFSRPRLWLAILLGLISIVPVIYASIIDHSTLFELTGIPSGNTPLKDNAVQVLLDLFGFIASSDSYRLRPTFSVGLIILMGFGVYKLLTFKHTARSYLTLLLGIFLVPLVLLNPQHSASLFPLSVLLMALGLASLISEWYRLFPRNPYARITGLVLLSLLVIGLMFSGALRYANSYLYSPEILKFYSNDLSLLKHQLKQTKTSDHSTTVVASKDELPFYSLVAHYDKRFSVSTEYSANSSTLIVTRAARQGAKPKFELISIITSKFTNDSDRLYVYKTTAK